MEESTEQEIAEELSSVNTAPAKKENADYTIYTAKELDKLLTEALVNEDYEKAATIRDELNKRNEQ
jgi:hypothetical protein